MMLNTKVRYRMQFESEKAGLADVNYSSDLKMICEMCNLGSVVNKNL